MFDLSNVIIPKEYQNAADWDGGQFHRSTIEDLEKKATDAVKNATPKQVMNFYKTLKAKKLI